MNRCLKALALIALITFFASCKKDDESVTPPRDYTVQYATEKAQIEEYMHTHYMTVSANFEVTFDTLIDNAHQSVWDQTDYPRLSKEVRSLNEDNAPTYTIYYFMFQQGVGTAPTRADNVRVAYKGLLFDGTQFDYDPIGQTSLNLSGVIEGWQEIMPMFKPGVYVDVPNSPDPPSFQEYGAGVMFVPSGLGYYNSGSTNIGAYEPLIFSFKMFGADYLDADSDGILNINEREGEFGDPYYYNTDNEAGNIATNPDVIFDTDYAPDYLDSDDDDDGFPTLLEITIPNTSNPTQYYDFDNIPTCTVSGNAVKIHLAATCQPAN